VELGLQTGEVDANMPNVEAILYVQPDCDCAIPTSNVGSGKVGTNIVLCVVRSFLTTLETHSQKLHLVLTRPRILVLVLDSRASGWSAL
jgi:hypothetical protein